MHTNPPVAPQLPAPADAVKVHEWQHDGDVPLRMFRGSSWVLPRYTDDSLNWEVFNDETEVTVQGIQRADGQTKRYLSVGRSGEQWTLHGARQFAEAILAAVTEAERMNEAERMADQ